MSDLSAIREARAKARREKKEYLISEIAEAITNGNYEFIFGFNSKEERAETESILKEISSELREDKLCVYIKLVEPRATVITRDKKCIFAFAYTCWIRVMVVS